MTSRKGRRREAQGAPGEAQRGPGVQRRGGVFRTRQRGRRRSGVGPGIQSWDAANPAHDNLPLPSDPNFAPLEPPILPLPPSFATPSALVRHATWPGQGTAAHGESVRRVERVSSASRVEIRREAGWGERSAGPRPRESWGRTPHRDFPLPPLAGGIAHGVPWVAGGEQERTPRGPHVASSGHGVLAGAEDVVQRVGQGRRVTLVGTRTIQPLSGHLQGSGELPWPASRGAEAGVHMGRTAEPGRASQPEPHREVIDVFGGVPSSAILPPGPSSTILPPGNYPTALLGRGPEKKLKSVLGSRAIPTRTVNVLSDPSPAGDHGLKPTQGAPIYPRARKSEGTAARAGNAFAEEDIRPQPEVEVRPSGRHSHTSPPREQRGAQRGAESRKVGVRPENAASGRIWRSPEEDPAAGRWGDGSGLEDSGAGRLGDGSGLEDPGRGRWGDGSGLEHADGEGEARSHETGSDAMGREATNDDAAVLEFPPGFEPASVRAALRHVPRDKGDKGDPLDKGGGAAELHPSHAPAESHGVRDARAAVHTGDGALSPAGSGVPAPHLRAPGGADADMEEGNRPVLPSPPRSDAVRRGHSSREFLLPPHLAAGNTDAGPRGGGPITPDAPVSAPPLLTPHRGSEDGALVRGSGRGVVQPEDGALVRGTGSGVVRPEDGALVHRAGSGVVRPEEARGVALDYAPLRSPDLASSGSAELPPHLRPDLPPHLSSRQGGASAERSPEAAPRPEWGGVERETPPAGAGDGDEDTSSELPPHLRQRPGGVSARRPGRGAKGGRGGKAKGRDLKSPRGLGSVVQGHGGAGKKARHRKRVPLGRRVTNPPSGAPGGQPSAEAGIDPRDLPPHLRV